MVDAREYHERTNHTPQRLREDSFRLDPSTKPRPYKIYEELPRLSSPENPESPETPALAAISQPTPEPSFPSALAARTNEDASGLSLSTLCHYATGVTKELEVRGRPTRFRAAACTGKLYHVDLYAVTGDLPGFDPGVYHFDPDSGGFDVLREGDYRGVLAAASGGQQGVAEAPITFVATSEWWRNAWKYRKRTYRHAFWDSGTVLSNLLATAHARGHRAEVVLGFADDPVADLLGIDPGTEAPLELVPVGSGDPAGDAPDVESIDPAELPPSDRIVEYPLVPDAWRQSALADGESAREWREQFDAEAVGFPAESDPEGLDDREDGDRIELDPVDHETASARPLGETIERRGSLREYSHEPISARKFATVLDRALGDVPIDCFAGSDVEGLLDCYCLVHAVEGIDQGAYEYHPGTNELERVGETDRRTAGHLALDQSVVGDAAVNVYLTVDVDAVVERFGNRGYRLAQLEGGIALGRLYLATYAHLALGGRGFTFYDTEVAEYLSPHAGGQTPMTLFAFGKPA